MRPRLPAIMFALVTMLGAVAWSQSPVTAVVYTNARAGSERGCSRANSSTAWIAATAAIAALRSRVLMWVR